MYLSIVANLALIIFPILLAIEGCNRGDYECNLIKFPWVSTTLGVYPNDKYYVFMMIFFACVQFNNFRAYY
jgi:hypothetical protein